VAILAVQPTLNNHSGTTCPCHWSNVAIDSQHALQHPAYGCTAALVNCTDHRSCSQHILTTWSLQLSFSKLQLLLCNPPLPRTPAYPLSAAEQTFSVPNPFNIHIKPHETARLRSLLRAQAPSTALEHCKLISQHSIQDFDACNCCHCPCWICIQSQQVLSGFCHPLALLYVVEQCPESGPVSVRCDCGRGKSGNSATKKTSCRRQPKIIPLAPDILLQGQKRALRIAVCFSLHGACYQGLNCSCNVTVRHHIRCFRHQHSCCSERRGHHFMMPQNGRTSCTGVRIGGRSGASTNYTIQTHRLFGIMQKQIVMPHAAAV
jgi:hypothetical protein